MSLGIAIAEQRRSAGLTQRMLAQKAGISIQHLRFVEQCRRLPSPRVEAEIRRALEPEPEPPQEPAGYGLGDVLLWQGRVVVFIAWRRDGYAVVSYREGRRVEVGIVEAGELMSIGETV
jgi:transcriptional regulator with XRE-family HTH domain